MNQGSTSPYREEDTEARERLDAEHEAEQREERAAQVKIRKLSRHALEKEPRQRLGMGASAGIGLATGAILGGIGWWATDDWRVLLAAPITGLIFSLFFFGSGYPPNDKFPQAPPAASPPDPGV